MKKHAILMKLTSLLAFCSFAVGTAWAEAPKSMLVVTVTKGFRHSSIPTAEKVLSEMAQKTGIFSVEYARNDEDLAEKMTLENLKKYDGIIFANTTGNLPLPDREGFLQWIKSGKAFVGMHSATDTFPGFPAYIEMIGGQFQSHGDQVKVECINESPEHPACRHFGPVFEVYDEIYIFKNFHREKVHGLLTLHKEPNKGYPGDFPVAWCKEYGQGKVFYTSLGHREDVWESEPYQTHILGGIKWALGLEKGDAKPQDLRAKVSEKEATEGFRPLFNGVDLSGWRLRNPNAHATWSAQNGMLVNDVSKGQGTDLVSEEKFDDFTIRYEYMIPKGSNSGLYLRGRYEIQILEDYESKQLRDGGNGGIYSVKAPDKFVSRKPGQWQEAEATIKGNRITVILNGEKIHDNVEVTRATGGELDSNLGAPGPVMLQGDHGAVAFRNIRIKPLK
jgi:uncharacterized protein